MARFGLTKKAKLEGYDRLSQEREALATYVWHVANGHEPDAVEVVDGRDPGESYTLALYGVLRTDGGTLVSTFRYPGQSASVTVKRFDDAYDNCMAVPAGCTEYLPFKISMGRLKAARAAAWEQSSENIRREKTMCGCAVPCGRLNHALCPVPQGWESVNG